MVGQENAERYRALTSSIEEGFCVVEVLFDDGGRPVDYRFLEVNRAFEQQTGLVGAVGRRMRELAPAHEAHWFETYGRVAVTGETVRFENEARALDGRWFEVTAFRVGAAERRDVGILFSDVTARKRAERSLRESEGRFRAMVNASSDVVYRMSADWSEMRQLDGRGFIVDTGKPSTGWLEEYIHQDDQPRVLAAIREAVRTKGVFELEHRVRRVDGTLGWTLSRAVPLLGDDGEIVEWFGAASDVTGRKVAEEVVRQSERQFRQLADAMPQMVWITRPDGYHEYYNRRWYDFTGMGAGSADGERWNGVLHPDDRERAWDVWRHSLATGEPYEIEYRLRHHSGEYRWALARALAIRDERGEIERWFGTCTDIDAMRRMMDERESLLGRERAARDEAESANRAKDRFLAVLSHELRTPLTPVAMAATALEMDPALPYQYRADVAMIRRNVELETRLIDDLLDLSRVISGKLRLHLQPTRVHDLVRHVLETVGAELHEKQLVVGTDLQARRDLVDADPARLQQAIWNLLKNAGKFTPAGGRVTIRTREDGRGKVVVEVSDTGRGIAADVLPRIFDPFEQGADEVTRRHGGLGLGLAIAKAVVDLHGGEIAAASEGEGRGATFAVTLPLRKEVGVTGAQPRREERNEAGVGAVRVLLVEDHPDTAKTLARLLRLSGLEVGVAHSVAGALEASGMTTFDVVVSDLGLPDGSGHDLMRELGGRSGVVGIAMSGYGMEEDIRRSREAGFVEHLVKPVDLRRLREAIARASLRAGESRSTSA